MSIKTVVSYKCDRCGLTINNNADDTIMSVEIVYKIIYDVDSITGPGPFDICKFCRDDLNNVITLWMKK